MTLQAATDPDLAEALGILIHDDDVDVGDHLRYEVATGDGESVGVAEIVVGSSSPLAAPTGLAATPTAAGIELVWDRPSEDSLVFAYLVEAAEGDGDFAPVSDDWTPLPPENESDGPYFRDERAAGETVRYRLVGRDLFGRETPPSDEIVATGFDADPLAQVYVVDSRSDAGDITLEWEFAGDERVIGLQVLRTEGVDEAPEPVSELLDTDVDEWTDTDVVAGVDYHYAVAAVTADDRVVVGPLWTQRSINLEGPSAATNLRLAEHVDTLTLSWDAPSDDDVSHYLVYAGRPGDDFDLFTLVGETTETSFDLPVPEGTLLDLALRVRAVNTSDVSGELSEEITGRVIDETPPSPPQWRAASGVEGAVELSWVATVDPDVEVVRVLRAEEAGPDSAGSVPAERVWEQVGEDLPPAATGLVDDDVVAGTGYDYVLVAVDASGNVSERSEQRRAVPWSLDAAGAAGDVQADVLDEGGVELTWDASDAPEGTGWIVSRWLDGAWVEISDLLTTPEFVDEGGVEGDRYQVTAVSPARVLGESAEIDTAPSSVPTDSEVE